jgi:hypothetical protein
VGDDAVAVTATGVLDGPVELSVPVVGAADPLLGVPVVVPVPGVPAVGSVVVPFAGDPDPGVGVPDVDPVAGVALDVPPSGVVVPSEPSLLGPGAGGPSLNAPTAAGAAGGLVAGGGVAVPAGADCAA